MDRWQGRVAVVCGASAGIGASIAKMLAASGLKVVACARRVDKVKDELAANNSNIYPYKCDLSVHDEIKNMFEWIENNPELGQVDVCVANAAYAEPKALFEGTPDQWLRELNLNVVAYNYCTQLSLKSMRKHNIDDGQIIMINSVSGTKVVDLDFLHFYTAAKYAVTALLEGWRQELRGLNSNIRVAGLYPGVVETDLARDAGTIELKVDPKQTLLQPEDIAENVKHIMSMPPHVDINGLMVRPVFQLL